LVCYQASDPDSVELELARRESWPLDVAGWTCLYCLFLQLMLYIRKHREAVSFGGLQILNHFIFWEAKATLCLHVQSCPMHTACTTAAILLVEEVWRETHQRLSAYKVYQAVSISS
jgi:hypothetical protein